MNLVTEPWIPVLHRNGKRQLASLHQVFTEGRDYADFAVRPYERIALMRLLTAIAQSALDGPKDIGEWDTALNRLPDSAARYLNGSEDSFELFHAERPFLQLTKLTKPPKAGKDNDEGAVSSVSKLDVALATGNNTTLFDHGANSFDSRRFPAAALPLMLLTFQCFSPGGLIAQLQWDGRQTSKSSKHAPCTPRSMLHTFVRRSNVLESVHANLLTKEDVAQHWGTDGWGQPVWEYMPSGWGDSVAIQNATHTYLGRLVPLSRFVQIKRDGTSVLLGNGFDYPSFPDVPAEASATVVLTKKSELRALLSAGEKAIWRELSALIVRRKQNEIGGPLTLRNVLENVDFDIWVGAFLTSRASIEDTVESVLHVPGKIQSEIGRGVYDKEVKHAEFVANQLGWAVETWREHEDGGWKGRVEATKAQGKLREKLRAIATKHYWTSAETLRPLLLAHIETLGTTADAVEQSQVRWRKAVWAAAFDAYRLSCGQDTPRQIRAYALGMRRLTGESNKGKQDVEQEPETTEV